MKQRKTNMTSMHNVGAWLSVVVIALYTLLIPLSAARGQTWWGEIKPALKTAGTTRKNTSTKNDSTTPARAGRPGTSDSGDGGETSVQRARPARSSQRVLRNQIGMELVSITRGSFQMGSEKYDSEQPVHQVTISSSFYMGRHEVTQEQWKRVMSNNPSSIKGDDRPVDNVSWSDVKDFIGKLNELDDGEYEYRLPTEAEWEYACRAGTTEEHAGNLDAIAWYSRNSGWRMHPVGGKQSNAFGLYDMHGNVWEWCEDLYHENYHGAPADGSAWVSVGEQKSRVLRGGSWNDGGAGVRSAIRYGVSPENRFIGVGFRLIAVERR